MEHEVKDCGLYYEVGDKRIGKLTDSQLALLARDGGSVPLTRSGLQAAAIEIIQARQTIIPVSDKTYTALLKMLDAPPQPNARLRKSLRTSSVWD